MTSQPVPNKAQMVSFLVQINLDGNEEKEEAFWKSLVGGVRTFGDENGKPVWRMTRVPQHGWLGERWRDFLESIGFGSLRENP